MKKLLLSGLILVMHISVLPPAHAVSRSVDIGVILRADDESVDVYLVNRTSDDKAIYSALDYRGVEREIEFHFHDANGACKACVFSADTSSRRVPPNPAVKILRPNEIYGARFKIKGIFGRHGMTAGCYGVYATYAVKDPPHGAFAGPINSNAIKICLK